MDILQEKNMISFEIDKYYSKQTREKKSRKRLINKIIKQIKARINRDIMQSFESVKDFYKPVKVGNFWSIDYTGCESNDDKNKPYQSKNTLMKLKYT